LAKNDLSLACISDFEDIQLLNGYLISNSVMQVSFKKINDKKDIWKPINVNLRLNEQAKEIKDFWTIPLILPKSELRTLLLNDIPDMYCGEL